jgi:hypothetical protein
MSLIDKAKELSGQAVEKVGESVSDLGGGATRQARFERGYAGEAMS